MRASISTPRTATVNALGQSDSNQIYVTQTSPLVSFGNQADITVLGDENEVGVSQDGGSNTATANVTGDLNLVTVSQSGALVANNAGIDVTGNSNDVTIGQTGTNDATVTIAGMTPGSEGDGNSVDATQAASGLNKNTLDVAIAGAQNSIISAQSIGGGGLLHGGINSAEVTVSGNSNALDLSQTKAGSGIGNTLAVHIFGDNNNNPSLSFTGDALATAAVAGGLAPGAITQAGSGNTVTMNVGSAGLPANGNLFAFLQNGTGNSISGTVAGDGNQAVVVQMGNANITNFSQIGNFNIVAVNQ